MVFQGRLHRTSVPVSKPPTYPTDRFKVQCKATVKVHGVFPSCGEICIFTNISTSLSLRRRQCGHRYAIRAGRNLPDKEFRYLRTVIVTAAVYRGFDQELAPHHLTFRHRAGVTPYTSTFVFAECCVFIKQSQPPFHCNPSTSAREGLNLPGRTFSRSYGANLPSSFSRVLSSALEFSSCPPVSVCGTVFITEA